MLGTAMPGSPAPTIRSPGLSSFLDAVTVRTESKPVPLQKASLAVVESRPGGTCAFVALFAELDLEDIAFLTELLKDPANSHAYIGEVLRADSHVITDSTVGRHRNRKCLCEQRA